MLGTSVALTSNPFRLRYATHPPQQPQVGDLYTSTTGLDAVSWARSATAAAPGTRTAKAAASSVHRISMLLLLIK